MLQEEYTRGMREGGITGEMAMLTGPPRHYGTHYSNPQVCCFVNLNLHHVSILLYLVVFLSTKVVLWYLLRLEPFSSLHIHLQDGRFDHPDRNFYSIAAAWHGATHNDNDVKELIPEMFYMPELFRNENGFDLGVKQNKEPLHDVVLPPWATSPEDFVNKNMQALERLVPLCMYDMAANTMQFHLNLIHTIYIYI